MFCFMYYFCFVGDFLNKYKVVKGKKNDFCILHSIHFKTAFLSCFFFCFVLFRKNKTMKGKNINIVCTLKYTNKENKWSFTSS